MILVHEIEEDVFVAIPDSQQTISVTALRQRPVVIVNEGKEEHTYEEAEITIHIPRSSLPAYSDEQLAELKLFRVDGELSNDSTFERNEGVVVHKPGLNKVKLLAREQVEAKWLEVMNAGYQHDFGEPHGHRVLQTRPDKDDATNWLTLKDTCNDALLAGVGETVSLMGIRCKDNYEVNGLTYAQTAEVLRDLRMWGAYALKQSWLLKNFIDDATDEGAINAVVAMIPTGIIDPPNNLNGWPVHVE